MRIRTRRRRFLRGTSEGTSGSHLRARLFIRPGVPSLASRHAQLSSRCPCGALATLHADEFSVVVYRTAGDLEGSRAHDARCGWCSLRLRRLRVYSVDKYKNQFPINVFNSQARGWRKDLIGFQPKSEDDQ
eukprot:8268275-Pyramimonas_sp.AAC.2